MTIRTKTAVAAMIVVAVVAAAGGWLIGNAGRPTDRYYLITTSTVIYDGTKTSTVYRLDKQTGDVWVVTPLRMRRVSNSVISSE